MPRPKAERPLPTGARRNESSGQITLMFTVVESDGLKHRRSQNKVLPSEPRSYATVDEAWEGYGRVEAYLAQEIDRAATVAGWHERWTNEDDKQWGAFGMACPERSRHAIYTYASHTRSFVREYGARPISSIVAADIQKWAQHPDYIPSGMTALGTMFKDAATAGLRSGANPVTPYAKMAEDGLAKQRRRTKTKPPKLPVVDQMLSHLTKPEYPRSLYGWFLTGTRTGMRGSEIDGMQFSYVDFEACTYQIDWQLHPRTGVLDVPKHESRRPVSLDDDVMAEIERSRDGRAADDDAYIWLNTFSAAWRHTSRGKWWDKQVGGTSLQEIVGDGVTMYNATRHHWASWAVNEGGMSPYLASILYGHKDGGKLIAKTYADPDEQAALAAARRASSTRPADLTARRRAA